MDKNEILRQIPAVEKVLQEESIKEALSSGRYPRSLILTAIRDSLAQLRKNALAGEAVDPSAVNAATLTLELAATLDISAFKRIVNATGVVVHTNLGRSPLPKAAIEAMEGASGYCNLEYDIEKGSRGHRHSLVEKILCEITGAEAAVVVNNNAAAVLLVLGALARGKEVIVSRGELVEIGGAFRVPDVMEQGGALLKEVGTTNKTHLKDYDDAISDKTALLLKVHTSNYKVMGFTTEATLEEIVSVGKKHGVLVAEDLGSGLLIDTGLGGEREPLVADSVKSGADIVSFSGDKLLGGPQAGIIVGKKAAVAACAKHPLMRALRPDKVTLAALEATLRLYRDPKRAVEEIPTMRMLTESGDSLLKRAGELKEALAKVLTDGYEINIAEDFSEAGGGSLPLAKFPTYCVTVLPTAGGASALEATLREHSPPVVARIKEDALYFDPRTLLPEEYDIVASALGAAVKKAGEGK